MRAGLTRVPRGMRFAAVRDGGHLKWPLAWWGGEQCALLLPLMAWRGRWVWPQVHWNANGNWLLSCSKDQSLKVVPTVVRDGRTW